MDEYDQPEFNPTFSDGLFNGKRGDKLKAITSRAHASRSATSIASRASDLLRESLQKLPKNTIITSEGIRQVKEKKQHINIVQKRNYNIKVPEPNYTQSSDWVIKRTILDPVRVTPVVNIPKIIDKAILDEFKNSVDTARSRKQELLADIKVSVSYNPLRYTTKNYIDHVVLLEEPSLNHDALDKLVYNLSNLINSPDKTVILDEFNNYNLTIRKAVGQSIHKKVYEEAMINKRAYFTSDT